MITLAALLILSGCEKVMVGRRPTAPTWAPTAPPREAIYGCKLITEITQITKVSIGECGYLWVMNQDSDGTLLAFSAFNLRPIDSWASGFVIRRGDGYYVELIGAEPGRAKQPLWRPVFTVLHPIEAGLGRSVKEMSAK